MSQFIERRDRWGNPFALWVLVGMCFILPACLWGLFSARTQNELQKWIPDRLPEQQTAGWSGHHFPLDDIVLLTWEGSSLADPRADRLVKRIRGTADAKGTHRGRSKLIDHVVSPHELIAKMERCELSHDEALERLAGIVIGAGPLRVQLTEAGRAHRDRVIELIRESARQTLGIEVSVTRAESSPPAFPSVQPLPEPPADGDAVPAGEDSLSPHDLTVTWPGMHWEAAKKASLIEILANLHLPLARSRDASPALVERCFQRPGSPIALAVYLSEAGVADRNAAMREIIASAGEAGIAPETVHIAGKPVVTAALDDTIGGAVGNGRLWFSQILCRPAMLLTGMAGVIVAFWLLRNIRLTAVVVSISCFTTLLTIALIPATHGAIDLVLVIIPTLVFATSLAAAVSVANGWRAAPTNEDRNRSATVMTRAWGACLVAGLTLALGEASLVASSLAPIRQFGFYAAGGTLASLLVTLYGLPALLKVAGGRPARRQESAGPVWRALATRIAARHRSITAFAFLALAMGAWGLVSLQTESRVIRHFSEDSRTIRDYEFIEDRLAGVLPVDVIVRFDRESQQQLKFLQRSNLIQKIEAEIKQLPEISGTLSLADFLPTLAPPGDHANIREKARYNAASRTIETRVKGEEQAAARPLLAVADDASEFNAEGDELWRLTAQAAMMSRGNYGELRRRIDEICCAALRGTSGSTVDKVPPVGRSRNYHPGASHVITGDVPMSVATQAELRSSFLRSLVIAIAGLTLVASVSLRHPWVGLLTMLPNLLAIGAVFGLTAWCGLALDIGSAMAPPVALAIASGGALRLVRGFRAGLLEQKGRAHALGVALAECGPAAWQTTFLIGAGLSTLCASDLTLISRFGWFTAALLLACFVGNVVVTPALLAGPFGRMIEGCTEINHRRDDVPLLPDEQASAPARVPVETVPGKPHSAKQGVRIRRVD